MEEDAFIHQIKKDMKAFVFPGQGAQFPGMGKDLYETKPVAKELFDKANEILGFEITQIMFEGTPEELKQRFQQPDMDHVFTYLARQAKRIDS